ncbi:MAG: hypothetical protein KDK35_21800, partial [Leptospiraceae bacterium]|nr:hypothetical protein [Leptospiraceae bacterium]
HFEKALEMATAEINNIVNTKIIKYDSSKYSLPEFASFLNLEPQNVLSLRDLFEDNKAFSEFVRAHTQSPYLRKIVDQAINLGGDNFV